MARLLGPDEGSRSVYALVGGTYRSAAGLVATIYSDAAATTPADILTYPGGATYSGGQITVDSYSRLPIFQFPDGIQVVYAVIGGGAVIPLYARTDDRLDALDTRLTAVEGGGGGSDPAASMSSATAATQRLQWMISRGVEDVSVLLVGDSTGVGNSAWFRLVANTVATQWPTHTIRYRDWNEGSGVYNASATIQTGSGSRIVDFYNASVASTNTSHAIAQYFDARVASLQPTVCLISHGHNEGISSTTRDRSVAAMLNLTESITAACPDTSIILVGQNPETNNTNIDRAAGWYEGIAESRGYGFVSVTQTFRNDSRWALGTGGGGLMTDTIHPNNAGYILWAATVAPIFTTMRAVDPPVVSQQRSTLLTYQRNLIVNGEFSTFATSPGVPDGWTAAGSPTVAKDTTTVEDLAKGYSVRITGSGSAAGELTQDIPVSAVAGRYVTLTARVFIPSSSTASSSGTIAIEDNSGTTATANTTWGRAGWRWISITRRIAATATSCKVHIYGVNAASAGEAYFDRVGLVYGRQPARFFADRTDEVTNRIAATAKLDKTVAHRGVNLAGAEFGTPGQTEGVAWRWPLQQEYDFVASRGHTLIRLPFMWERIQPTLGAALDATQQARLVEAVGRARTAGLKVVLDLHNYAAYNGVYFGDVGAPTLNQFIDVWLRISNLFKNDPTVVGYGLMNEPKSMPTVGPETGRDRWLTWSQAVVDAIRGNGDVTCLMIGGYSSSSIGGWFNLTAGQPNPWIIDPVDNFMYEAHSYWDSAGGTYPNTYAQEDVNYASWGSDGTRKRALAELKNWINWLRTWNVRGFIGEFGWPRVTGATTNTDSTAWNALAEEWLATVDAAAPTVWLTAWAAGSFWSSGYNLRFYINDGSGNLATLAENAATLEAHNTLHAEPVTAAKTQIIPADFQLRWRGWNGDIRDAGSTGTLPNGTAMVSLLEIVEGGTLEQLTVCVNTAAATPTAGQCFAAIFDAWSGARIAVTGDIGTQLTSTGFQNLSFTAKTRVFRPGERLYGYLLFNGTTPPTLNRFPTTTTALTGIPRRWGVTGAATSVPTSLSYGSLTAATGATWMAVTGY